MLGRDEKISILEKEIEALRLGTSIIPSNHQLEKNNKESLTTTTNEDDANEYRCKPRYFISRKFLMIMRQDEVLIKSI